jgi:hypothetical protein
MAKSGGPGEKMTRAPRTNNVPSDDDEQTQVEIEMASSGRSDVVPREGLVGAHLERRAPEAPAGDTDEGQEPTGPGSDVAPTRRAEERERERHRLERALGRAPAAEDGKIHDQRAAGVTREELDEAARQADRNVVGHDMPKKRS